PVPRKKHGRIDAKLNSQLIQVIPCHLSFDEQESRDRRIGNARGGGDGVLRDSLGFDKVSKHVGSTYVGNENVLVLIPLDNVAQDVQVFLFLGKKFLVAEQLIDDFNRFIKFFIVLKGTQAKALDPVKVSGR